MLDSHSDAGSVVDVRVAFTGKRRKQYSYNKKNIGTARDIYRVEKAEREGVP